MPRLALLAAVLASLWLPSMTRAADCAVPGDVAAAGAAVLQSTNAERARAGLGAVALSPALVRAAQAHACDMAKTGKFSHRGSGGSTHATRAKAAGCRWKGTLAENIGHNYASPAQAMAQWMGSKDHRANILNRKVRLAGVAYAKGASGSYWVMVLAGGC